MKSISKVLSILLAVLLMISAPLSAFAADYDIGDGDITVRAEDSRQTVEQGGAEADDDAPVIARHVVYRNGGASPLCVRRAPGAAPRPASARKRPPA